MRLERGKMRYIALSVAIGDVGHHESDISSSSLDACGGMRMLRRGMREHYSMVLGYKGILKFFSPWMSDTYTFIEVEDGNLGE